MHFVQRCFAALLEAVEDLVVFEIRYADRTGGNPRVSDAVVLLPTSGCPPEEGLPFFKFANAESRRKLLCPLFRQPAVVLFSKDSISGISFHPRTLSA